MPDQVMLDRKLARSLFWLVHRDGGEQRYFIAEAGAPIFARLRAAIAGLPAETFHEIHALDAATARKVPRRMIGRVLTQAEAEELLERLG